MSELHIRNVLVTGLVLGLTAALVVWWLERFEVDRLHTEVHGYLKNYDEFREWLQTRADGNGGSS